MSELDSILADILANPRDDFPRQAYADWQEEFGDPGHAEFIRLQLLGKPVEMNNRQFRQRHGGWADDRVLFVHGDDPADSNWYGVCVFGSVSVTNQLFFDRPHQSSRFVISRGFVERISLPLNLWMQYGSQIVRHQPIEHVEVTDKSAYHSHSGKWFWRPDKGLVEHALPAFLWNAASQWAGDSSPRVIGYDTEKQAMDALSRACLKWVKGEA